MKCFLYYTIHRHHTTHLLLMALVIFALHGCKKEKVDNQLPQIVIHSPTPGSSFHPEDIIPVSATITDDNRIEKVRVQIVNAAGQSFMQTKEFFPDGNSYELHTSFLHNDLYLSTGPYYVKITAFDKDNEKIEFRQIQLTEVPVQLMNILLIRSAGSGSYIDTLSGSSIHPYAGLNHSHHIGAINSRHQLILSAEDDELNILRTSDLSVVSTHGHFNSTVINAINDEYSQNLYSTTIDGYIYEINQYGSTSIYAYFDQQSIRDLLITRDYIFLYHHNLSHTQRSISVIKKSTRNVVQSLPVPVQFNLVKMIFLGSEDKILLVGNEDNSGKFIYYNRNTNALNEIYTFYNHSHVFNAWNTSPNRFIVAQHDGLVNYTYNLNMLNTGIAIEPHKLIYEKISDLLYAYNETGVYVFNTNASSIINFIPYADCKDLMILYNK